MVYLRIKTKYVFCRLFGIRPQREKIFGLSVHFFSYDNFVYLFDEIFVNQEYYFSAQSARPTIIDCGANIGMATLYFKLLYPQAKIIAFEPDPETFGKLRQNIEENHLSDVAPINAALSNQQGSIEFFNDPTRPGSFIMSTIRSRMPAAVRLVRAELLSNYIDGSVDFVKIDVEGAETDVVAELAEHGKLERIAEMVIEYHHHIVGDEDNLSRLLSTLEKCHWGYQLQGGFPATRGLFQDLLIWAYNKAPSGIASSAAPSIASIDAES